MALTNSDSIARSDSATTELTKPSRAVLGDTVLAQDAIQPVEIPSSPMYVKEGPVSRPRCFRDNTLESNLSLRSLFACHNPQAAFFAVVDAERHLSQDPTGELR